MGLSGSEDQDTPPIAAIDVTDAFVDMVRMDQAC